MSAFRSIERNEAAAGDMGAEGGKALYQKRGKAWMRELGRRGFASLVNRHFGGDRSDAIRWLHAHAAESQVARLVHEEQATADRIHCTEIPIILDPDNDPFFTDPTSWRERVERQGKGRNRTP
jgi:hypothetical protein